MFSVGQLWYHYWQAHKSYTGLEQEPWDGVTIPRMPSCCQDKHCAGHDTYFWRYLLFLPSTPPKYALILSKQLSGAEPQKCLRSAWMGEWWRNKAASPVPPHREEQFWLSVVCVDVLFPAILWVCLCVRHCAEWTYINTYCAVKEELQLLKILSPGCASANAVCWKIYLLRR